MSRSQFHSIKLFILRHAWLNLWDKHMTTGRINQVTVLSGCHRAHWQKRTVLVRTAHRHDDDLTQRCTKVQPGRVDCKTRSPQRYSCVWRQSDSLGFFVKSHWANHWWKRQRPTEVDAAFQRRALGVSDSTYNPSSKPKLKQVYGTDLRMSLGIWIPNRYSYKLFYFPRDTE